MPMQTEPINTAPPERKRRWYRFSLRQLFMFVALVGILLAFGKVDWHGNSWQRVTSVEFSPNGRFAALGGCCGRHTSEDFHVFDADLQFRITLLDLAEPHTSPRVIDDFTQSASAPVGWPGRVTSFSPDGKSLISGFAGGRTQLWDVAAFKSIQIPIQGLGYVRGSALSPDGKTLAVVGGGDLILWQADTGALQRRSADDNRHDYDDLRAVAFSPDGKLLAIGSFFSIEIIDLNTMKDVHQSSKDDDCSRVASAAFSPDGTTLAVAGWDRVHLYAVKDRTNRANSSPVGGMILGISFAPDGASLAVAGGGGLALIDTTTGLIDGKPLCDTPVDSVAISADGRLLLAGDEEGNATVWDLKTRQPVRKFSVIHYPTGVPILVPIAFLCLWLATAGWLLSQRRCRES